MGIIAWIIFGLIAKMIMLGRDGGGFILTGILGIVGAVVRGIFGESVGYWRQRYWFQPAKFLCGDHWFHPGAGRVQND